MKKSRNIFSSIWKVVNIVNRYFGFVILMGIVFCIGGQIFSRAIFGHVWSWAEEIAEIFLIGTIVLYNGYAEQTAEHVRLEALFSVFPKMKQPMLQIGRFATMFMCLFVIYTEYLFWPNVVNGTTKVVHVPLVFVHGMIAVGFFFYFVDLCINCWKHFKHIPIAHAELVDTGSEIFDEDITAEGKEETK